MTKLRLLPVVIVSISALLVFKTVGLMSTGGYVFTGVSQVAAAGAKKPAAGGDSAAIEDTTITLEGEPTISDTSPTLSDRAPTLANNTPAHEEGAVHEGGVNNPVALSNLCDVDAAPEEGEEVPAHGLVLVPGDCLPLVDAPAVVLTPAGAVPLADDTSMGSEGALNDRLSERRTELQGFEQELAMRAALVEAAEKRIEERQQTLQTIESQISSLVEQRKAMEEGQFASLVAMYGTMKPKDAAAIFDELDMEVLLRVAKMMTPRKMAPIMAAMTTSRAQELTVRMATDEVDPAELMGEDDLAALPQIIGQ